MIFSKVPIDKLLHALVCYFIVTSMWMITGTCVPGIVAAIACSVGKEIYDKKDYGLFSWSDLLADAIGTALALSFILFDFLVHS